MGRRASDSTGIQLRIPLTAGAGQSRRSWTLQHQAHALIVRRRKPLAGHRLGVRWRGLAWSRHATPGSPSADYPLAVDLFLGGIDPSGAASLLNDLCARTDLEHLGAARRARPLSCRSAILHRDSLRIVHLALSLALHTVAHRFLRGGHRQQPPELLIRSNDTLAQRVGKKTSDGCMSWRAIHAGSRGNRCRPTRGTLAGVPNWCQATSMETQHATDAVTFRAVAELTLP